MKVGGRVARCFILRLDRTWDDVQKDLSDMRVGIFHVSELSWST